MQTDYTNIVGKIFAEVFSKTLQPLIITDKNLKILYYNKAAEEGALRSLGKKLSQGVSVREIFSYEDFFKEHADICRRKDCSKFELKYNIEHREINLQFEMVYSDAGYFIIHWADFTGFKRKIDELKESVIEKEKMFSIIAHDLINPLTGVMGFSELLSREFNRVNSDKSGMPRIKDWNIERLKKITERIDIINNSTKEVYSLLENLLDWSRSKTRELTPLYERINIFESIESVISFSKSQADFKNIKIENNADKSLEVKADRNMFKTIIRNFISNAIKFTPRGGRIEISTALIQRKEEGKQKEKKYVRVDVSDSGIGIPEKTLNELLLPGFNSPTKGTESERGTGIGLKVSKEFAEKMKGHISVRSKRGKGSIFSVTLPA